jgi:hypothetical protein
MERNKLVWNFRKNKMPWWGVLIFKSKLYFS